ncbi:allophanate hydrolase [Actibacterium mucosum KCTC 23349]|uniref:Allophanate hydrolase n=1 Tax=Actibacterium mucosum KCTC 23349 TaxID=1454373 RepID=A0A037ZND3_9RHOB|nr:cupin domain-containing protein [Actibacterium mucosum]KAJ56346.1 allophanate hydrolase [Actibacterium mucosum KCTC 23349]
MLEPKLLRDMLNGGWKTLNFEPFRDGITIGRLLDGAPAIAVLRYEPGAQVPMHEHMGPEMIVVLEGSQSDEFGTYRRGDVVISPAGSRHSVHSEDGCVVLLNWSQPVRFTE